MNVPAWFCVVITVVIVSSAVIIVLLYRRKTKKTLKGIADMLDKAIDGSFTQEVFDESLLSAVEAKLARYLSICARTSKNLLEEEGKIKGLISDISHQTKTPLANILLYSQLLGEYELPQDCAVCVNALSAQAEKLNFLISVLVKASRLETGIITVSPEREVVEKLLDEAIKQILPQAEAKDIFIAKENTEENADSYAYFDLKWTTEAIYNILDNAVKYSESGKKITIRTIPYELFCCIEISDQGLGIDKEELSKIFTRFYRSGAVSKQEGVGLGLFLAREIIVAEGGYIKVSSTSGKGSVFAVFLPRTKKE